MHIIPTTKTAVEKLCARAREIQRTEKISYTKAQNRAAQEAGYDDWRHIQQSVKLPGGAPQNVEGQDGESPTPNVTNDEKRRCYMEFLKTHGSAKVVSVQPPSRGDIFHSVMIEDKRFDGFISGGNLYLLRKRHPSDPWFVTDSSVHLGVAEIWKTGDRPAGEGPKAWHVCKYGPMEPCVYIADLSKRGRLALAYEFGIPATEDVLHAMSKTEYWFGFNAPVIAERLFFLSPAFAALVKWCQAHPRKARAMECQPYYLGDWKSAAIAGRWPVDIDAPVSDEELAEALREPVARRRDSRP